MQRFFKWYYLVPALVLILVARLVAEEHLSFRLETKKTPAQVAPVSEDDTALQFKVGLEVKVESEPTPAAPAPEPESQYPELGKVRKELYQAEQQSHQMTKIQEAEFVASTRAKYLNLVIEGKAKVVEVEFKDGWYRICLKSGREHLWAYLSKDQKDLALRLKMGETIRVRGRIWELGLWFTPRLDQVEVL